jgi:hypothetical protein
MKSRHPRATLSLGAVSSFPTDLDRRETPPAQPARERSASECQTAPGGAVSADASRSSSSMRCIALTLSAEAARAIETSPARSTCGTRRSRAAINSCKWRTMRVRAVFAVVVRSVIRPPLRHLVIRRAGLQISRCNPKQRRCLFASETLAVDTTDEMQAGQRRGEERFVDPGPRSIQYIPPMSAAGIAPDDSISGIREMTASVVSSRDAIDAAFCRAERTTLVGSITPDCTRFS